MTRRRDSKKRVLRRGEGQRNDGRYYFKYQDALGDIHFVYSWKLEPYDIPPVGKESELSLREMENYFKHICQKYNSIYRVPLPKVTPHVCRHTYCSNMAHSGMNPKTLQYLMGHSDISVTLNTYAHTSFEHAKEELKKVNISEL